MQRPIDVVLDSTKQYETVREAEPVTLQVPPAQVLVPVLARERCVTWLPHRRRC